jgi:hypothetical protein
MASKIDKISKLTAGLASLPDPGEPAPPAPAVTGPRPRGRPPADTVAVNLRMPTSYRERVVIEAARRSHAARRTITPQAVILELMDAHLPPLPDAEAEPAGRTPAPSRLRRHAPGGSLRNG